jgi:hypothetical protein
LSNPRERPLAIATASTTLAWMIAFRQRWVLIGAVAAALALSSQALFTTLTLAIARGTFG